MRSLTAFVSVVLLGACDPVSMTTGDEITLPGPASSESVNGLVTIHITAERLLRIGDDTPTRLETLLSDLDKAYGAERDYKILVHAASGVETEELMEALVVLQSGGFAQISLVTDRPAPALQ